MLLNWYARPNCARQPLASTVSVRRVAVATQMSLAAVCLPPVYPKGGAAYNGSGYSPKMSFSHDARLAAANATLSGTTCQIRLYPLWLCPPKTHWVQTCPMVLQNKNLQRFVCRNVLSREIVYIYIPPPPTPLLKNYIYIYTYPPPHNIIGPQGVFREGGEVYFETPRGRSFMPPPLFYTPHMHP